MSGFLRNRCTDSPGITVRFRPDYTVEDLHFADPATLAGLRVLVRRLAVLPLGVLTTVRPLPRSARVDRFLAAVEANGGRVRRLGTLDGSDAEHLLGVLAGGCPGPGLRRQGAGAGGNPLFLVELVGALAAEGAIVRSGDMVDTEREKLPATMRHTILRRLGYLSEPTRSLLGAAAVLGVGFEMDDLSAVTERNSAELLEPLGEACRAGVISEGARGFRFSHELVRDALYQELAGPLARSLHGRFARRLATSGAPAGVVGAQFALAAPRSEDAEATLWLARAGREAAELDPAGAVRFLRQATEILHVGDPVRDELSVELAMALARAGRPADAESVAKQVLSRRHDSGLDAGLQLVLGRALVARGATSAALAAFEAAAADPALGAPGRGEALAEVALGRVFAGDLAGAEAAARRVQDLGERLGDELATCVALCTLALLADCRAEVHEALELATRAVAVADASPGGRAHHFPAHLYRAYFLMDHDRITDAGEALRLGRQTAERLGAVANLPAYHFGAGVAGFLSGESDDALVEIDAGLTLAEELRIPSGVVWAQSIKAIIAVHRDDLAGARSALAAAEAARGSGSQPFWHWSIWAAALLAEANGDLTGALGMQSALVEGCLAAGSRYELVNLAPDLVRLALATGDTAHAEKLACELEEVASTAGTRNAAGAAAWCRALLDSDPDALIDAANSYERSGWLMPAAQAAAAAAEALAQASRRDEATKLFARAQAGFETAGEGRDAARARAVQCSLGLQPGARGARTRPTSGWESLTPTEARIAALAADGLTSAEIARRAFVSVRTVEGHLGRVFAKLGVHSRVQLAAAAREPATAPRPSRSRRT
jgi:DNA-binding CsgD family transcriptional regulator/tetratricopeptide (TPR) repeat protein